MYLHFLSAEGGRSEAERQKREAIFLNVLRPSVPAPACGSKELRAQQFSARLKIDDLTQTQCPQDSYFGGVDYVRFATGKSRFLRVARFRLPLWLVEESQPFLERPLARIG